MGGWGELPLRGKNKRQFLETASRRTLVGGGRRAGSVSSRRTARPSAARCFRTDARTGADSHKRRAGNFSSRRKRTSKRFSPVSPALPGLKSGARRRESEPNTRYWRAGSVSSRKKISEKSFLISQVRGSPNPTTNNCRQSCCSAYVSNRCGFLPAQDPRRKTQDLFRPGLAEVRSITVCSCAQR